MGSNRLGAAAFAENEIWRIIGEKVARTLLSAFYLNILQNADRSVHTTLEADSLGFHCRIDEQEDDDACDHFKRKYVSGF